MQEKCDVFDKNLRHLGVRSKSFCHSKRNKKLFFKLSWVWIINENNEILVQRRAKNKKFGSLQWDMSAAGHVQASETPEECIARETFEEIGIQRNKKDFEFMGLWENLKDFNFAYVYLLKTPKSTKFTLNKKEVFEVEWLSFDKFVKLIYSDEFCMHSKDYKDWIVRILKLKLNKNVGNEIVLSKNLTCSSDFVGTLVEVTIERPLGSRHPKHGFLYPVNYGYIAGTISADGEELDAYVLGEMVPLNNFVGRVIAVIHRTSKTSFGDDKLIVVADGKNYTNEEIKTMTDFQENWTKYNSIISR